MKLKKILAAALAAGTLATTVTLVAPVAAEAASKPTAADRRAMVKANRECAGAPDEVAYENCVVGAFVMRRHRYVDERHFTTGFGRDADHYVVLVRRSQKVG